MDLLTPKGRETFYRTKEWKALRLYMLSVTPWCEECIKKGITKPATDVHHIIDIKDDPSKVVDVSNLECLCHSCHSSHTMKQTVAQMLEKKKQNPGGIKRLYKF